MKTVVNMLLLCSTATASTTGGRALKQNWKNITVTPPGMNRFDWYQNAVSEWEMLHFQEVFPTRVIHKGDPENFEKLPEHFDKADLEAKIEQEFGFPFDDTLSLVNISSWLDRTYTDGFLVMHGGTVVYEKYFGNMTPYSRHKLFSVSKGFAGIAAKLLIHGNYLKKTDLVAKIIPDMEGTALGNATVDQVLDMTTAFQWSETQ